MLKGRFCRTQWHSNQYVKGAYSFSTDRCDEADTKPQDLLEPVFASVSPSNQQVSFDSFILKIFSHQACSCPLFCWLVKLLTKPTSQQPMGHLKREKFKLVKSCSILLLHPPQSYQNTSIVSCDIFMIFI